MKQSFSVRVRVKIRVRDRVRGRDRARGRRAAHLQIGHVMAIKTGAMAGVLICQKQYSKHATLVRVTIRVT